VRAINLLPRDYVRRTSNQPNVVVLAGVVAAVLLTALLAGLFLMSSGKVAERQETLKGLQDELASIPAPPPGQVETQNALAADKQKRVQALGKALGRRVAWDRVLRELSLVLPDDVWLKTLRAKAPVSPSAPAEVTAPVLAPGAAPTQFTISGFTYSHDAVARLLSRLEVVPDLVDVELAHSSRVNQNGRMIVDFEVVANVRTSGAPTS